jgi:hypothetical protein
MPVAFIPLVALCLFVIYLAVGFGTLGRRYEIGLITLRGVGPTRRFWLTTGEPLAMILIVPDRLSLGHVAVAIARVAEVRRRVRRRSAAGHRPFALARWPERCWPRCSPSVRNCVPPSPTC